MVLDKSCPFIQGQELDQNRSKVQLVWFTGSLKEGKVKDLINTCPPILSSSSPNAHALFYIPPLNILLLIKITTRES